MMWMMRTMFYAWDNIIVERKTTLLTNKGNSFPNKYQYI